MTLSEELKWRGFVNQSTLGDLSVLDNWQDKKFYNGYDASSDSLTIGNLAVVMMNKLFIRHGWEPVILAGGATSLIGDPGGKDSERTLQDEEQIAKNVAGVKNQLEKLFGESVHTVNNLDWFKGMTVLDFLRVVGKHFSMTPLVQRDYISKRMGEGGAGISYTEFSYTILQGYDFLRLHQEMGVSLQLAGSDQWGNCLSGVELVRRVTGDEVHALTMPLIVNKATGKKFGKSEEGAVWLDAKRTAPNDFYQFWVNLDDDGVEGYLKIYTDFDKQRTAQIMDEFNKNKASRSAQKALADEVTTLVHGKDAAKVAREAAESLSASIAQVGANVVASGGTQSILAGLNDSIADTLFSSGLASSKTEARQLLADGGVYINDIQTKKENFEDSDFVDNILKLRRGKTLKNTVIIKRK